MSNVIHMQMPLSASRADVFRALTEDEALETWFAERASVSLDDGRYDFWGRHTPELPAREDGRHVIEVLEPGHRLQFRWRLRQADTTVDLRVIERDETTVLGVWHRGIPPKPEREPDWYALDDVWFFWLENLRRYLDGRKTVRCDFSRIGTGDITHSIDVDAPVSAVWNALTTPEQLNRWLRSDAPAVAKGTAWVDWGEGVGALEVIDLQPERRLSLAWKIEGLPTVVTWTLDGTGGATRLVLSHSGFGADLRTDGEFIGWFNYLVRIQALAEYGERWSPPLKDLATDVAAYHPASIRARQSDLLPPEMWTGEPSPIAY